MLEIRVQILTLLLVATACSVAWSAEPARVEFNRDIRPILSDACFHCHGPDKAQRKGGLRLDTEEGALAALESGAHAIVRGDVKASAIAKRIASTDPAEQMPPPDSGRSLSAAQRATLLQWITAGAPWQKHWSLLPPQRATLPVVKNTIWPRTALDRFVLARLEREGLTPAPEAQRGSLLRRVTLDLTGLPPTPAELDAYLADKSDNAYEKVVDRLLASPGYGERMASDWLDAARYADTNGYQTDGPRVMWRWRDWVIDAFNRNLPFDQFTVEQLAGDMLPNATLEQRIASGFNRNHRGNAEGGIIPAEYAVEYVVDRVDTTATVWLGLTLGCARCHDHKFDPCTQKEFYSLFALFNNIPERGRAVKFGNSDPQIKAPTAAQQAALGELEQHRTDARRAFDDLQPQLLAAESAWQSESRAQPLADWSPTAGLVARMPFDGSIVDAADPARAAKNDGPAITFTRGPIGDAAEFNGQQAIAVGDVANFGYFDSFSISAWIQPQKADGVVAGRMTEADSDGGGYNLQLEKGRLQLNLVRRWLDDSLRVETAEPLELDRWRHVVVTYDGSRVAAGVRIYIDSEPVKLHVVLDELNQNFTVKRPFTVGLGGPGPRFAGRIDELRVYDRAVSPSEVELLATVTPLERIVALQAAERTPSQQRKLSAAFLAEHAPPPIAAARDALARLEQEKLKLEATFPTTMVMQEMPEPRATHVLTRGEYDKPGDRVAPGVPLGLSWSDQAPVNNRLDFARWLVDPRNPLTARVAVNRVWQIYFGAGLVKTVDDFGSQGFWPTHPELLDFLATEFVASGWNVKALHKSIVMSAAYRQSSRITPELAERDPDNRLLARGPRLRLSAQMIRDQALAASGLLVEKVGGPSVLPYQPVGLWKELTDTDFTSEHGESLYRRSLYTYWKRTVAPPAMVTFDAAARESCWVRQTRTNTPLQALTLMNEVTFVEAARMLAEQTMRESNADTPERRLAWAFRRLLARDPKPAELRILHDGWRRQLERFRGDPQEAERLLAIGEASRDTRLDPAELAAYATTANLLLNLDEAISKP